MYDDYRIKWLKSIYPEFKKSDWNTHEVIRPEGILNFSLYKESKTYYDDINPLHIVGIDYAYAYNWMNEINWLELLLSLKKFDRIIRLNKTKKDVINHILHTDHLDQKCVSKFGNQYITTSGQHRLCLAKFLDLTSVGVRVTEYTLQE